LLVSIIRGQALPDHLPVARDDAEQVVEVVGDAARQPSDRLHLLGLTELLLERAQLGHVARDRQEARDAPAPLRTDAVS
jgi:hypothetical protein